MPINWLQYEYKCTSNVRQQTNNGFGLYPFSCTFGLSMFDSISNISLFGITFANNQPNQEKRFYIGLILN